MAGDRLFGRCRRCRQRSAVDRRSGSPARPASSCCSPNSELPPSLTPAFVDVRRVDDAWTAIDRAAIPAPPAPNVSSLRLREERSTRAASRQFDSLDGFVTVVRAVEDPTLRLFRSRDGGRGEDEQCKDQQAMFHGEAQWCASCAAVLGRGGRTLLLAVILDDSVRALAGSVVLIGIRGDEDCWKAVDILLMPQ